MLASPINDYVISPVMAAMAIDLAMRVAYKRSARTLLLLAIFAADPRASFLDERWEAAHHETRPR